MLKNLNDRGEILPSINTSTGKKNRFICSWCKLESRRPKAFVITARGNKELQNVSRKVASLQSRGGWKRTGSSCKGTAIDVFLGNELLHL